MTNFGMEFLTLKAKKAFSKALILYHFDLECHICIETDVSRYTIIGVLSQMI